MLYNQLHALVPTYLHETSGKVFYSGLSAFAALSHFYLLGFNPGGDPIKHEDDTIAASLQVALARKEDEWSAYVDESWTTPNPGGALMQKNVQYLCSRLGVDPRRVPASNLIFGRSRRESLLTGSRTQLIRDCWPFHQAVIDNLKVRVIICFGQSTGRHVRRGLMATELVETFVEDNERRWTSKVHGSLGNRFVVTLTHPGVAYWTVANSDPTGMIERLVNSLLRDPTP